MERIWFAMDRISVLVFEIALASYLFPITMMRYYMMVTVRVFSDYKTISF